jgi:hypothetical protein
VSDIAGREWRFYIDDMIECGGKVLAYTPVLVDRLEALKVALD